MSCLQDFLCLLPCAAHFTAHLEGVCKVILWEAKLNGVQRPLSVNQGRKLESPAHQFSVLSTISFLSAFPLRLEIICLTFQEFESGDLWASLPLNVSLVCRWETILQVCCTLCASWVKKATSFDGAKEGACKDREFFFVFVPYLEETLHSLNKKFYL